MDYIREAAEILKNYEHLEKSMENLKNDIGELKADLNSVKEINYSDMPHGSDAALPDDKLINKMFVLQKKRELYAKTKKKLDKINKIIDQLPKNESNVLEVYYVKGYRGVTLLKELNCSERQFYRDKSKAIRTFSILLFGIDAIA